MKIDEAVKELDNIFLKYKIKDEKNILGFRNNFIDYVRTLNEKDLKEEYDKQELTSALLDSIPVSLIKDIIEENKSYLEYANTAYEYTQREVIEENIKILEELLGKEK